MVNTMLDLGGTYRAITPEETLANIEPLLWDRFGISRVANITGLDNVDIPTYVAIRPLAKLLTTAQGKGITHTLAKISAIMESIEGWHSENMPEPDLFGSHQQLKDHFPLVDLNPNINHGPFEWIDIEQLEIPWAKGVELLTNTPIYFPYTTINVNTAHYRPGYRYFPPTTNGLASGNSREEAICHALFEVIEREIETDQARFATTPQVDVSTIRSPHLLQLLEKVHQSQLELEIWNITNHLNIPCYVAIAHDTNDFRQVGMQIGSGAHCSSVVALSRAITEAIQGRVTIIAGSRDDLPPSLYKKFKIQHPLWQKIFARSKETLVPFIETNTPESFDACLHFLLETLKQNQQKQVIIYDHTREGIGLPVVHILIPGFRYKHGSCFACPGLEA